MGPFASLTIGALFALTLTNIAWWRALRRVREAPRRAEAESRAARAELVTVRLSLMEAVRPHLGRNEGEPTSTRGLIERLSVAIHANRDEVPRLRSQLKSSSRRVAALQRQLAECRSTSEHPAIRQHLAEVSSERDGLREKVVDLTARVRASQQGNSDTLKAARWEIDRLRDQLRSANHALIALDTAPSEAPWITEDSLIQLDGDDEPTEPSHFSVGARPPVP